MRRILPIAAALALTTLAQPVRGQSADFPSFMTATCFTFDCSVVQFDLETTPVSYAAWMTWTLEGSAADAGITFNGTVEAESGLWSTSLFGDAIQLSAMGSPVQTPAWFRLGMTGVTSAQELTTGEAVRYNGAAWETLEDGVYSGQVSLSGYVTPEPGTWVMLLTGLLLVGAVGFRRSYAAS